MSDPTLLALARGGSRWAKAGFVFLLAAVLIAAASATVLRPGKPKGGGATIAVEGDPGFKLSYARGELRVASERPERVELVDADPSDAGSRLLITPLPLADYDGSPTGALPMASPVAQRTIAERFDRGTVEFLDEGLVNVGPNPGYQMSYVARRDGVRWYGRAAIVVADVDGETSALLMDGQEERSKRIVGPRSVGRQGDLRRPMRTLVFVD